MAWFAPTSTCFTCAGRMSCSSINRIISVIAGWLSDPDGYGFSEMPGAAKHHGAPSLPRIAARSEEHTSELQSHLNLVCRLLLEKKKKKKNTYLFIKKKKKKKNK